MKLPVFIEDVVREPRARGVLVAGALALFAVGLVPRALSPGLPKAQEALKAQPEVENVFLLVSFVSAAAVLAAGALVDIVRRRGLILGALGVMGSGALVSLLVDDGPVFYLANMLSVAAAGVALAYGIGSVAIAYEGVARATALGIVYAAYGAGSAAAPALLTLIVVPLAGDGTGQTPEGSLPPDYAFQTWPAYAAAALSAAVALWGARRWMPRIPGGLPAPRRLVAGVGLWTVSIIAIVTGLLGLRGPAGPLVPVTLVLAGALGLSTVAIGRRRTQRMVAELPMERRGLSAALVVGVAVGFAQAVPLLVLPPLFEYVLGYGTLFGMMALAPFAIALLAAGPVSGVLLQRYGPRGMMAIGSLGLGVSSLLLALVLSMVGPETPYAAFIVPLALIGAGFVLATTVRTAIVFASTPRGLPASAAAINEASVALGSRVGVVIATGTVSVTATAAATSLLAGRPDTEPLLAAFSEALGALGTPRFKAVIASLAEQAGDAFDVGRSAFLSAYLDGVVAALVMGGTVGIVGAILAWLLTGRRDPLRTVFDMRDERLTQGGEPTGGPPRERPGGEDTQGESGGTAPGPVSSGSASP
jgi:MFS family permease